MKLMLSEISSATIPVVYLALSGSGTWYKCPNNHLYPIGDCGQPNETSRCPDCKEAIAAGTYHVPAQGNVRIGNQGNSQSQIFFLPQIFFSETTLSPVETFHKKLSCSVKVIGSKGLVCFKFNELASSYNYKLSIQLLCLR